MKHKGSLMEYHQERLDDLMRAYDTYIAQCKYIRMPEVYDNIVNTPAKRFWVSDIRASLVISSMIRGTINLNKMCTTKKEMYEEIYKRVIALQEKHPELSISELCSIVVEQPAPKFYLTSGSAKIMICKYKKEWIQKKLRRLRVY